jgi:serine/threonine protein kinase
MIDFGTAKDLKEAKAPFSSYVSTRWYRAPEQVLRSNNYGPGIDIFAAGCILAEFYNIGPLFPGTSELD